MESVLQNFAVAQVYTFMLVFCRIGTAMMIMPGVGDGFVPERIRLFFALAFAAVCTPIVAGQLPEFTSAGPAFLTLLAGEVMMGLFIGGIARIFMAALDTAGMLASMHIGLANAQIFNPAFATQGSVMGAFLSITGALLLFATNLHHLLFGALIDSYRTFPPGLMGIAFAGDMADAITTAVGNAFAVGFHFAMPFMIVTTMVYVAMGILTRMMPQLQIFAVAMPLQIMVGFLVFVLVASAGFLYWMGAYSDAVRTFLLPSDAGGI
ncbi:MAG: flagellar biosynthetic protein FliR [Alphaproteobacteria bacterium]|nr:flagellar biosynthetic protein FliR [Alphaproteobacteria bacterium]USO08081.1 MAG: flagellar biosynthetic protein FliR [Rhodospirillales bacterium]